MIRRSRALPTLALVAGLLLTGCRSAGSTAEAPAAPSPPAAARADAPDGLFVGSMAGDGCNADGLTQPPRVTPIPLPADSVLVSATRCLYTTKGVPGDGEWLIRTRQKADTGLDAFAAALRLPSQHDANPNLICPQVFTIFPLVTVTDTTGRQFVPALPTTACGDLLPAAVDAMDGLAWVTVAVTQVRQTQTQQQISNGCVPQAESVIALQVGVGSGPHRAQPAEVSPQRMYVCRYNLDPANRLPIPAGAGGSAEGGVLASATLLEGPAAERFQAAINAAPPAGVCTQPQAPFAVVAPGGGTGPDITVELSGCYRALVDGENYLRQLDATTVATYLK
jgi:hypothetical protein